MVSQINSQSATDSRAPMDLAASLYEDMGNPNFVQELADYLGFGYVVSTPDVFAMGKLVDGNSPIPHPDQWGTERKQANTWYIRALAGKLPALIEAAPFMVEYISFERWRSNDDQPRLYKLSRLCEIAQGKDNGEQTVLFSTRDRCRPV